MAKKLKVVIMTGKSEDVAVDIVQGSGDAGLPTRIRVETGAGFALREVEIQGRPKPLNVKGKRVGKDLHVFFDEHRNADLILLNYYEVMPEGVNSIIGQAENGAFYEYWWVADTQAKTSVLALGESGTSVQLVLGGDAIAGMSPALAALTPAIAGSGGWLVAGGGLALAATDSDTTPDTQAPATPAALKNYVDNTGAIQIASSAAATTDDTTPGFYIGTNQTDKPKLYVDGVQVPATYNSTAGTLALGTALNAGTHSFSYTLTDAAGNVATSDTLAFELHTQDAAFTLKLDNASNSGSQTDLLTNDVTPTISGTGTTGDIIQVTMPGTGEVLSTAVAADGKWSVTPAMDMASGTVTATAKDVHGNTSAPQTLSLAIDASIATPSLSLVCDSGGSAGDKVSKDATLALGNLETGALVEYSTNGNTWTTSFTPKEGANTVTVRQSDAAGNVAESSTLHFTLDTTAPAPTLSVSPISGDNAMGPSDAQSTTTAIVGVVSNAQDGDKVNVYVHGKTFTGTVDASGHYSVEVNTADLIADKDTQIDGSVSVNGGANYSAQQNYAVDTTAPVATVALNKLTPDNLIDAAEAGQATLPVTGKVDRKSVV